MSKNTECAAPKQYILEYEGLNAVIAEVSDNSVELTYPTGKKSIATMTETHMVIDGEEVPLYLAFDIPVILALLQLKTGSVMDTVRIYDRKPIMKLFD